MSGDETDDGKKRHWPVFTIIDAQWQSDELKALFRGLDRHYIHDWKIARRIAGKKKRRRSSGNPPRVRVVKPDGKVEDGVAPRGLWRNCYNPAWLATLMPHELEELEMIDGAFRSHSPKAGSCV